jgi:hypothetical protein
VEGRAVLTLASPTGATCVAWAAAVKARAVNAQILHFVIQQGAY